MNPRKPKVIKMNQGTYRKDREVNEEPEPTFSTTVRNPPPYIGKYGKKIWKELAVELVDSGVMTEVDWQALEICCSSYNTFRECRDSIYNPILKTCTNCGSIFYKDDSDCPRCECHEYEYKKHKQTLAQYMEYRNSQTALELTTMGKAMEQFLKYSNVLGINPVARNRIDISQKSDEIQDPIAEIVRKKQG